MKEAIEMAKRHKVLTIGFIIIILLVLLVLGVGLHIQFNILKIKQQYVLEATEYLGKKYSETMVVTENVVIGDEKSVQAFPIETPELVFFVRKGDAIMDTYLYSSLRYETELLLKDAFIQYEPEIYVSELKWCNPTDDGKFETFSYLDGLYETLGRVPSWKDVNEYQKIEYAKVNIKFNITDETYISKSIEDIQKTGCHIEKLQIIDNSGRIYKYSF